MVQNRVFFQHPDLMRILTIHENVMAIMMNTLGRRAQAESDSETQPADGVAKKEVRFHTISWVTTALRFPLKNCFPSLRTPRLRW